MIVTPVGRTGLGRLSTTWPLALPLAVFAMGVLLAALAGWQLHLRAEADAEASFRRGAERTARDISSRLRAPLYGLSGVRGLLAASQFVSRSEFREYIAARELDLEFPGVRGLGLIERVPAGGEKAFVARQRADDAPAFSIRRLEPAADAGDLPAYVIKYIEPRERNAGAAGLDVGSEARRRAALEQAIDSGEAAFTRPITLVQDTRRTSGLLLYLPVYRRGADAIPAEQRRLLLRGVAYAPIVIEEVLAGLSDDARDGRALVELFDAAGPDAGSQVFAAGDGEAGTHQHLQALALPGLSLTLRVRSTPAFDAVHARSAPWGVFGGGVLASLLLAALLRQQATGRRRAEVLAQQMTAELDRLAMVAQRTSNAVIITDRELRISWVNEAFTRLYGYSAAEAAGHTPGELLGSPLTDPAALLTLREAARDGTGCRVEVVNRRRDGSEVWVDTEVQPALDERGQVTGFVEIASDITGRRAAERRMATLTRENEALLGTIRTHAIVSVADADGTIIEANDAFCRISGYSREELLGSNHRIVNSGLQPPAFWASMWATIAAGQPWRGQICNRAKDGSRYWVDSIIAPFVGADGRIEKYVSLRTDITASKRAAQDLAAQRRRLENIVNGTQAGTWEHDLTTGEDRINATYAAMLGHDEQACMALMAGGFLDLVHPDDVELVRSARNRHLHGLTREYAAEFRMRHRDGHWVWMQTRGRVSERDAQGEPLVIAGIHLDISERKAAEAALRASQSFLDRTGRIGGVGGWQLELDDMTLRWTDQTFRIHDLEPDVASQPDLERSLAHFVDGAGPQMREAVQRGIDQAESFDLELPLRTAAGRDTWVRVVGEPQWHEGRCVRLIGAMQDIGARRRMEAELRANNEVLASVMENLPCGLSVFDAEFRLVAANSEFRRLLDLPGHLSRAGSTRFEDVARYNAERGEYGPGAIEDLVQAAVARAREPAARHQFERVRPDGTPIEIRGAPMPGGGFVTTYTDISARRRAEAEIQRSAALLRGAIDAIDEAFVLYDPEDRLVFCNDKYRQLYDLSADLIVPGARFEQIVRGGAERGQYREAAGRIDEWVADRVAAHRAGNTSVVQRLPDGRALRIVERRMPDGHIVGFRIDISELVRATEEAEQASVAKSQFLANMSHEIRTPMNAILGMLALLKKTELSTRQADYAHKTEGAARSLLGLLNDILDFSKVEAGKMTLDPHPFRIDQLLRDLGVILSANVGAKPVEVLFDVDPALPRRLVGDALRLQQVLINLGGNAIKFTAQGEVVIAVAVQAREGHALRLEFSVRDTGIGIAPENQARIFSGFTQAESSITRRFGGTGLGLAICQRLVALMGGELRLDSAPGRGSCFSFGVTLQTAADGDEPPVADALGVAGPAAESRAARRVLVVDDNATARTLIARMGEALGWNVDLAASGEAALAMARARADAAQPYETVFVDWQMPGLDGWQTSRELRERGWVSPSSVVVMVTAHGREMLAQRDGADQDLLDAFLVKPVTASMLFDALADGRRGLAREARPVAAASSGARRLAGLRVLLTEDNLNNQQVARELLEDEGAVVQIAHHGQEAVEAVAAADLPFDVVLMDLQMPVMDGFTATARIRQDLGQTALPIIAMTANAMASDREACLAAGMNDHVGKPFDLDHLVQVLLQRSGRLQAAMQAAMPAAMPTGAMATADADAEVQADVEAEVGGEAGGELRAEVGTGAPAPGQAEAAAAGVALAQALRRLGGKLPTYTRMLRGFVRDLQSLPEAVRAAADDAPALARQLHTLKGVAATLGADALATRAAAAERDCARADATARAVLARDVADILDGARAPLQALLQALQAQVDAEAAVEAEAVPAADPAAMDAALQHLAQLLQDSDMAALDALSALRRQHGPALGEAAAALEDAMAALDFEQALRLCRSLRDPHPIPTP